MTIWLCEIGTSYRYYIRKAKAHFLSALQSCIYIKLRKLKTHGHLSSEISIISEEFFIQLLRLQIHKES